MWRAVHVRHGPGVGRAAQNGSRRHPSRAGGHHEAAWTRGAGTGCAVAHELRRAGARPSRRRAGHGRWRAARAARTRRDAQAGHARAGHALARRMHRATAGATRHVTGTRPPLHATEARRQDAPALEGGDQHGQRRAGRGSVALRSPCAMRRRAPRRACRGARPAERGPVRAERMSAPGGRAIGPSHGRPLGSRLPGRMRGAAHAR